MTKKITLLTTILLLFFSSTYADPITKKTATVVANNWISTKLQNNEKRNQKDIDFVKEISFNEQIVYYIINYRDGGFVVVSADDATKPILAYSDTSAFDFDLENPTTQLLLKAYKSFVYENALTQKTNKSKSPHAEWKRLLTSKTQSKAIVVSPFMDDILFTQSKGFERFCPSDDEGQSIVGCVATAMSQVMRYYEFPSTGRGQMSYNHSTYGNLSVNFENQQYDWDNMSKTMADDENAKLSYHTGVAVKMNYGISANGGSGAYTRDALSALKRNFKYNNGSRMVYRSRYSDLEWGAIIKKQLDEKRPVLYSGRSKNLQDPEANGAGHLFALDGYDTTDQGDFFHINWGWGGRTNGYFSLTEMITHDGKYNWIDNNAVIIDLFPTNVAPLFTSEPVTSTRVGSDYEYKVSVTDENRKDVVEVSLVEGPSWLTLTSENGAYIIQGTPSISDAGSHKVVINAADGSTISKKEFSIIVLRNNEVITTSIIDFETGDFSQANFSENEEFSFSIENNENQFSQSATILDNQESVLALTQDFPVDTSVKFDYKVSSESRYDFLIFKIDGRTVKSWSGEKAWTTESFDISSGSHTLTWSYKKDASVSGGEDLAMVDNIIYEGIGIDQEAPSIPLELVASDITQTSLILTWNASTDNAKVRAYEIYKDDIKLEEVADLAYTIKDLSESTAYTFSVKAIDYANNTSEGNNSITVKTEGEDTSLNYCESKGNRVQYEWIDFVSFGDMKNATDQNGGYADFTDKVASVVSGSINDLVISAGFRGNAYTEYFSVWIDYNQNGSFEENEMIVNESINDATNNTYSIEIPDSAILGSTRMRVSMKYNSTQTACEVFADGEVEDYTVNITQGSIPENRISVTSNQFSFDLQIFPNPSSDILNIKVGEVLENGYYQIMDASGRIVEQNSFTPSINIEKLQTGMYFITVFDKNNKYTKPFIKSKK